VMLMLHAESPDVRLSFSKPGANDGWDEAGVIIQHRNHFLLANRVA
jgi:hypothetical protein